MGPAGSGFAIPNLLDGDVNFIAGDEADRLLLVRVAPAVS